MMILRGCRRCGGDLYLGEDVFGKYLTCLQCGYLRDVEAQELPRAKPAKAEQQGKAA